MTLFTLLVLSACGGGPAPCEPSIPKERPPDPPSIEQLGPTPAPVPGFQFAYTYTTQTEFMAGGGVADVWWTRLVQSPSVNAPSGVMWQYRFTDWNHTWYTSTQSGYWSATADIVVAGQEHFAAAATPVGDLNGDGVSEFATYFVATETSYGGVRYSDQEIFLYDGAAAQANGSTWFRDALTQLDFYDDEASPIKWSTMVLLGDLDDDGVQELAIYDDPACVFPVTALLDPTYDIVTEAPWRIELPQSEAMVTTGPYGIQRGDIDGDGIDEVFTGRRWYWGADLRTPGDFGRAEAVGMEDLGPAYADCERFLPMGDVDGDGRVDLYVACGTTMGHGELRAVTIPLGDEPPQVRVRGTAELPLSLYAAAVGDADGDGIDDLVAATPRTAARSGPPQGAAPMLLVIPGSQLRAGTVSTDAVERRLTLDTAQWSVIGLESSNLALDARSDVLVTLQNSVYGPDEDYEYIGIVPAEGLLP